MTSILSTGSQLYQQLSNQTSGTARSTTTTTSLADVLDAADKQTSATADAYSLNLSPDAQDYLSKIQGTTSTNLTLTKDEQTTLDAILEKYKDLPITDANYDKLKDDLATANLSPEFLAKKNQVQNFDSTQALIDAMNGKSSDPSTLVNPTTDSSDSQTKQTNYLKDVLTKWKKLSDEAAQAAATDPAAGTVQSSGGASA